MRRFVAISIIMLATGCGPKSEPPSASGSSRHTPVAAKAIGPQFWKYDLKEYSIVTNDVVSGPGGRWISVRYQRRFGETTTREAILSRIAAALQADGWKAEPLPTGRYVLSRMWESSTEDLHFTRRSKRDEPAGWFFAQTVFVSKEADTLAVYCEVGW